MSKAFIILDMPSSCSECPCCYVPRCEVLEKSLKSSEIYERKPDWCPLREVPQKYVGWHLSDRARGWNACIDEIMEVVTQHDRE